MTRASVLVFAPHPDDEVIACGGTIMALRSAAVDVHIVFCTDGERSHQAVLGIDSDPSPAQLGPARRAEAATAARLLGVGADRLHFLGAPDTRVGSALPVLRSGIDAVLAGRTVSEVYMPHEQRECNADHRATGQVVLERLAHAGLPARVFKYVVWDERTEAEFGYVNRPPDSAGAQPERLVKHDISAYVERKLAALRAHRSQTSLYGPTQQRAVIPPAFVARLCARHVEQFWLHPRPPA